MSLNQMISDAREKTERNVGAVFKRNGRDAGSAWLGVVIAQAAATGSHYIGRKQTAAMLYEIFEACESGLREPDFRHIFKTPAVLTRGERLARWWAANCEAFCAGWIGGMVFIGLIHWWASSV